MPNTKSAARRARNSERRHAQNKAIKSRLKTLQRSYLEAVEEGNKDGATKALKAVNSALDKAAKTGVIPKARASRLTSRLSLRLKPLAK